MEFLDAVKIAFKKYAQFRGKATRPEYWWFFLFTFLVSLIGGAVDNAIHQSNNAPVQSIVNLALFLPQLTIMVRRNRDAGFSALWLLLWLLPVALFVYGYLGNPNFIQQVFQELIAYQTQEQALINVVNILVPVIGPAILASAAVGIFFFVVSLLPTKKQKPVAVATIDY
jgi:uncharacterized membrane protein YhaH (DUF805 family)